MKGWNEISPAVKWLGAAFIAGLGAFGPFLSDWLVRHSDLADENADLKSRCELTDAKLEAAQKEIGQIKENHASIIKEKDDRIAEQRERIASIERQLNTKEIELKLYEINKGDSKGKMLTRDADIAPMLKGTIRERLGLAEGLPPEEMLRKTWNSPLLVEMLPGVIIPAPSGMLEQSLEMLTLYSKTNFEAAARIANKLVPRIDPMVAKFVFQGAHIDCRFSTLASEAYKIAAEDAFFKKDFKRAANLMGLAAGIVGPKPSPELLAKEAIMAYRASDFSQGIFTVHIGDAIKRANNDPEYIYQIHEKLAQLGYLQLYLPNKEQTDIGEKIDWSKGCPGKQVHTLITFKKGDDVWSIRWAGFLKFEEYNLSQEFRESLKKVAGRKIDQKQKSAK